MADRKQPHRSSLRWWWSSSAALVAWAGSWGGATVGSVPVLRSSSASPSSCSGWPSYRRTSRQTERFYDLTGAFTYISAIVLAVVLSGAADARSILLLVLVLVWAGRLGPFLFRRVRRAGKDDRFDEHQAFLLPPLADVDAAGAVGEPDACGRAGGGDVDRARRARRVRVRRPCRVGARLCSRSHGRPAEEPVPRGPCQQRLVHHLGPVGDLTAPNYFGEITLWVGIAIIALPVLQGWQFATLISPVFVYLLITRVSGVPLLEKKADAKWGGQEAYEAYKRRTPVLVPFLGRKKR